MPIPQQEVVEIPEDEDKGWHKPIHDIVNDPTDHPV